jgi:hypothetical protein
MRVNYKEIIDYKEATTIRLQHVGATATKVFLTILNKRKNGTFQ